jgi:16S rRNA A1518/A1519 N6-dimethyltransferase RsmA/KsgA/DIM1 with predicted DNA glycosylase/AP lyase activity
MVESLAPYVPSEPYIVTRMLELARVGPEDIVVDLGCGDGRILIAAVKEFHAQTAVGYEMQRDLYTRAVTEVTKQGLARRITVINGDILQADLSHATVITLYLTTAGNTRLRPKFETEVHAGTRIVSHAFTIPGWTPSLVAKCEVPYGPFLYLYVRPEGDRQQP